MIAKIAVSAANFSIDKPYSYVYTANMPLQAGMRVIVPFGRGNRQCEGIVLSTQSGEEDGLKQVQLSMDEKPLKTLSIPLTMLSLVFASPAFNLAKNPNFSSPIFCLQI